MYSPNKIPEGNGTFTLQSASKCIKNTNKKIHPLPAMTILFSPYTVNYICMFGKTISTEIFSNWTLLYIGL